MSEKNNTQLFDTVDTNPAISRRDAMKLGVGAAAAMAVGSAGSTSALAEDDDDSWLDTIKSGLRSGVEEIETVSRVSVLGPTYTSAYVGTRVGTSLVDWDFSLWGGGSNEHAEDALRNDAVHDFRQHYRHVINVLDLSETILDYAFDGIFTDAKLVGKAAIEDQMTQQEVEDAMLAEAEAQVASLQETVAAAGDEGVNFIKHYAQQGDEADAMPLETDVTIYTASEVSDPAPITLVDGSEYSPVVIDVEWDSSTTDLSWTGLTDSDVVYGKGDSHGINAICAVSPDGIPYPPLPHSGTSTSGGEAFLEDVPDDYLFGSTLDDFFEDIEARWETDLEPDIKTWAADAYDAVAAGDIALGDLLTPTMVAATISEDEPANRALASLRSAGIPTHPDHPVDLEIDGPQGTTIQARGVILGSTGETDAVSQGDLVDPGSIEHGYYMNYWLDDIEIEWPHYEELIDGGVVTLTELPDQSLERYITNEMTAVVTTTHGESATFEVFEEFDRGDDGPHEIDISEQLEQSITEVHEISLFSTHAGESDRNRMLSRSFEIVNIEDTNELDYEHDRQIQTADNYLTQEEWDEYMEEMQDILDELEDSNGNGIGLPGFGNVGDWLEDVFGSVAAGVAVIGAAIVGLFTLSR